MGRDDIEETGALLVVVTIADADVEGQGGIDKLGADWAPLPCSWIGISIRIQCWVGSLGTVPQLP